MLKNFIATHYAFEGSEGWTTLTTAETLIYKNSLTKKNTESNSETENSTTSIKKKLKNRIITKSSKTDLAKFKIENPHISKIYSENKESTVLKSSLNLFETHKTNIVLSSIHWILNDALYSLSSKDFQFLKNFK
jgi:membrane-bound lytic murein transglycosylase D